MPFEALRSYAQGLTAPDVASRARHLKRALSLLPSYDEARVALGRLQFEARDYASAQETLSKVGADSPLLRAARFQQGVALLELGRYREASGLYAALAAQDPTPAVLNNQAIGLMRSGAGEMKASQVLRKAIELDPSSTDAPFNLGWALLAEGDPEARGVLAARGGLRDPLDNHARLVLAWTLRQAGHDSEARRSGTRPVRGRSSYETLQSPDFSRRFERVRVAERVLAQTGEPHRRRAGGRPFRRADARRPRATTRGRLRS